MLRLAENHCGDPAWLRGLVHPPEAFALMPSASSIVARVLTRLGEDFPLLVVLAVMLDAWRPLPAWGGFPWMWLDMVAIAGVAAGAWMWRRPGPIVSLATPLDRHLLALVGIATLMLIPSARREDAIQWMHVGLACLAVFYVAVVCSRRSGRLPSVEPALAAAIVVPSVHGVVAATQGMDALAASSAAVDAAWGARNGEFKLLAMALPPAFARAREADTGPIWRVLALIGAVGLGVHASASWASVAAEAFARLADPLYFSNLVVSLLVIATVLRLAWQVSSSDERSSARWRALALSFAVMGAFAVIGEITGGAAVRAFAAISSAGIVAAAEAPGRREADDSGFAVDLDRAA